MNELNIAIRNFINMNTYDEVTKYIADGSIVTDDFIDNLAAKFHAQISQHSQMKLRNIRNNVVRYIIDEFGINVMGVQSKVQVKTMNDDAWKKYRTRTPRKVKQ